MKLGPEWKGQGLVFASITGGLLCPRNMLRVFHRLLGVAGLKRKRFHDLRHTSASLLLAQGVTSPRRGCRSATRKSGRRADLYSHLLPELTADAALRTDAVL